MLWRLRKWAPKDSQLCLKCGKFLAKNTTCKEIDWMRICAHEKFYGTRLIRLRSPVTRTMATHNCPKHHFSLDGLALLSESKEMIIPLPGANGSYTM